jgi:hypothetical protein
MCGVESNPKALHDDYVAFGFAPPEEPVQPDFVIWPEHETAYEVFKICDTQWHFHPVAGVWVGLNYQVVFAVLAQQNIPPKEHAAILDQIRVMERAILTRKDK